ncbi:AAA family ATPase [Amycolatopsis sp. cmx-11-51]|uniref:AAA family ATPase n=1 Tax=unclassified Amycolatopsis TaxID=2618356 RepID=UPI0039E6EB07
MTVTTGIERIRIRNYRVLRDVELDGLTPITALLGPNGSGKSTLLDALLFVSEAVQRGLGFALARRGGLPEIRTIGSTERVEIEVGYQTEEGAFEYRLAFDGTGAPEEILRWRPAGAPGWRALLEFHGGQGVVYSESGDQRLREDLADGEALALDTFGRLNRYNRVAEFRKLVLDWHSVHIDVEQMRKGAKKGGKATRLSSSGDNIAIVVEQLQERRPEVWAGILRSLRRYVPRLEDFSSMQLGDGSFIVRLKERGADELISPDHISDGTLTLLAYLVAMRDPASVLLLEEPENQVHPRLHYPLADEARMSESGQVIVATHSPRFVDATRPNEVWMFARGVAGNTEVMHASVQPQLVRMVESGGALGDLWTEGYFRFGDPLAEQA